VICAHPVTPAEVDAIFSQDFTGIFNTATVTIKTTSGSTYEIFLVGPTIVTQWNGRPIQVRRADYRIGKNNRNTIVLNEYIGVSHDGTPRLLLISDIEAEEETLEHVERTRMRLPISSTLLPETEITIGDH
jgi:hypothetical protein